MRKEGIGVDGFNYFGRAFECRVDVAIAADGVGGRLLEKFGGATIELF